MDVNIQNIEQCKPTVHVPNKHRTLDRNTTTFYL